MLFMLGERAAAEDELIARYASTMQENEEPMLNVLGMTAALRRVHDGVESYMQRTWPIHYTAELPVEFCLMVTLFRWHHTDPRALDRLTPHCLPPPLCEGCF